MEHKPRLLIDCSFVEPIAEGSESHFIHAGRLIKAFSLSRRFDIFVLVAKGSEHYIQQLVGVPMTMLSVDAHAKVFLSPKLDRLFGLVPHKRLLQQQHIDIVLSPYANPFIFVYPRKYRQHAVVHDVIPDHRGPLCSYSLMNRFMAMHLHRLISISDGTRMALRRFCLRNSEVVHNCVPWKAGGEECPVNTVSGHPFILDINRLEPYKNPETLIRAFSLIADKIPHQLYLKGLSTNAAFLDYLRNYIEERGLSDRIIIDTTDRSEAELRWLYSHASLFVSPSLIEGFGYTPIEAAISGTPVLVSDIPVLNEVTMGRVPTFNPHSDTELAHLMENTLNSPPTKEKLQQVANFFSQKYSNERYVEQMEHILLKALNRA